MNMVDSNSAIDELVKNNRMVLVYFGSSDCNVCNALKPKVEELLKNYPKIKSAEIKVEKSLEISAAHNIFTVPAILVFVEGRELFREARHISIQDIDNRINRYYSILFE